MQQQAAIDPGVQPSQAPFAAALKRSAEEMGDLEAQPASEELMEQAEMKMAGLKIRDNKLDRINDTSDQEFAVWCADNSALSVCFVSSS